MSTLVLTSLNPFTNLDYQAHCFEAWAHTGYEVLSVNADVECDLLLQQGIQKERIRKIPIEDTAEHLFGKPVPRILPLLESALASKYEYVVLTNSDIYPAHRKPISACLAKSFESAIFTRTECLDLSLCNIHSQSYYRGGLDLFWLSKKVLSSLLTVLRQAPVAERMTFGVPGWDFYLAHVLYNYLDASIIDGSIFIHQSHTTTYGGIDEFGCYATEMTESGYYSARNTTDLAHEFSTLIQQQCAESTATSNFLKLALYKRPATPMHSGTQTHHNTHSILKQFSNQLNKCQVVCTFSEKELEVFANKQIQGNGWPAAISLVNSQSQQHPYKLLRLQLLLLALLIAGQQTGKQFTLKYPKGNLHAVGLKQIVQNENGESQEKYIFDLFAGELINYKIINKNLLKYLFTAASSNKEKTLFFKIISICKQGLQHA